MISTSYLVFKTQSSASCSSRSLPRPSTGKNKRTNKQKQRSLPFPAFWSTVPFCRVFCSLAWPVRACTACRGRHGPGTPSCSSRTRRASCGIPSLTATQAYSSHRTPNLFISLILCFLFFLGALIITLFPPFKCQACITWKKKRFSFL